MSPLPGARPGVWGLTKTQSVCSYVSSPLLRGSISSGVETSAKAEGENCRFSSGLRIPWWLFCLL